MPTSRRARVRLVDAVDRLFRARSLRSPLDGHRRVRVEHLEPRKLLAAYGGTPIGTAGSLGNYGNTREKAFDGNLQSYVDAPVASGAWVGMDLGQPTQVTEARFAPRRYNAGRMVGGKFQGSTTADFSAGVADLLTFSAAPAENVMSSQAVSGTFRHVRYLSPANSWGNIGELEFHGPGTGPLPAAPAGAAATAISSMRVQLAWTDSVDNESGYRVLRSTDGANFTKVGDVPADATTYVDGTTSATTAYTYRVVAFNAVGTSPSAPDVGVTTPVAPVALAGTVIGGGTPSTGNTADRAFDGNFATFYDTTQGNGSWVGLDLNEVKELIYVRYAPRPTWANRMVGGKVQGSNAANFASGVVDLYTIAAAPAEGVLTEQTISNSYRYVRYLSPNGGYGNVAEVRFFTPNPAAQYPPAPTGLSAAAAAPTQVALAWTDNANNEDAYRVYRSTDGITFAAIVELDVNATGYVDTTASPNTTYYYRVAAANQAGLSASSNTVEVLTPMAPPNPAMALTAAATSATSAALAWSDESDNEVGFCVERRITGGGWSTVATVAANVTSYGHGTLAPQSGYEYRILSFNAAGDAVASNVAAVTTPAAVQPMLPKVSIAVAKGSEVPSAATSVVEDSGTPVTFTVTLSEAEGSTDPITVPLLRSGDATLGDDCAVLTQDGGATTLPSSVTFTPPTGGFGAAPLTYTFTVTSVGDTAGEPNERLTVSLGEAPADEYTVGATPATLTIADDDGGNMPGDYDGDGDVDADDAWYGYHGVGKGALTDNIYAKRLMRRGDVIGNEWSGVSVTELQEPSKGEEYLRASPSGYVKLQFDNLMFHTEISLSFDVLVVSNFANYTPAYPNPQDISAKVDNERTIVNHRFSAASYHGMHAEPLEAGSLVGSVRNHQSNVITARPSGMWYGVCTFTVLIPHSKDSLTVEFRGPPVAAGTGGGSDWGLMAAIILVNGIVPTIAPVDGQAADVGGMVESNKGAAGEKHFVSPKAADKEIALENKNIPIEKWGNGVQWRVDGQPEVGRAAGVSANQINISRSTARKTVVTIVDTANNDKLLAKFNVWIVWAAGTATRLGNPLIVRAPVNDRHTPSQQGQGTAVRAGWKFEFVVQPQSILTDFDIPQLGKAPTVPTPGVGLHINDGNPFGAGASLMWDISRRLRAAVLSPNVGSEWFEKVAGTVYTGLPSPRIVYTEFPEDAVFGNDDISPSDEENDPYGGNRLISYDTPTTPVVRDEGGSMRDTIESRAHFGEFLRLRIGNKWYRISDFVEWRFHAMLVKVSESDDKKDYNNDEDEEDDLWIDNGSITEANNIGW